MTDETPEPQPEAPKEEAPAEPQPEPEPINYVTTNPYCRGMGTQTDPGRP